MIKLGKSKLDARVRIRAVVEDLKTNVTPFRVSTKSSLLRICSDCKYPFKILTDWLVGERDPLIIGELDVMNMGAVDSSWYEELRSEEVTS